MRIFIVLESWGVGGTESYVEGLTKVLQESGHQVFLVLLKTSGESAIDFLSHDNIRIRSFWQLPKYFLQTNPQVVNLHLYSHLLAVTCVSRLLNINVVSTLHMPIRSWGLRHRIYWRLAVRLAHKVVGVSRLVTQQVKTKSLHPVPISGGVNKIFFDVERLIRQKNSSPREFRIAAVGRLSREKDWSTLVKAVSLLRETVSCNTTIDFYGTGPLQGSLEQQAFSLNVSVEFHGFVSKTVLAEAFKESDLSVLPSTFEGFGLAAIESMAAGVPTITSDFEASKDFIVEGATGYRFPAGDAEVLSRLLLEIIEDPFEAEKIAFQGREFVRERFSEDKTYLPYLKLFNHKK